MNAPATDLRHWLDAAWDCHDREARALADELMERARALPDDTEGSEAVRLARHVTLGHLADPQALRVFLARLPRGQELDKMRVGAEWAIDALAGQAASPLPQALRWGPLADVIAAEIELGRLAEGRARLFEAEAVATGHEDVAVRRAYAAACNNLALTLRTGRRGDASRDALMIEIAQLSKRAWARAGTWMNVERADYQLAMCYAAIGQGEPALHHARECLRVCEAEGADAGERFFAHEALVHAHRVAGHAAGAAQHRARMATLLQEVADDGMRAFCRQALESTPQ